MHLSFPSASRPIACRPPLLLILLGLLLVGLLARPSPAHAGVPSGSPVSSPVSSAVSSADDPVGVWPLSPQPEVVERFDPPELPWGAGHRGVDLAGRPGQLVRSALPGRVAFAGRIAGRGVVVVSHGDTRTTYEPVAASLTSGTTVAAGEVLGRLEPAGSHCFPRACLHWGWIRGSTYLDPLLLVGSGPVRLLPLWRASPGPAVLSGALTPASGPRVGLLVGPSQPVRGDVGVALGGRQ